MEWKRDGYTITDDRSALDLDLTVEFLASSYWARGIPRQTVEKSLQHSLCFVLLDGNKQAGFARAITDYATFAYLADVFIAPRHQRNGLGKWLVECVMSHPQLRGLRRWLLATRDAHSLYRRFGFTALKAPEMFMELHDPAVYRDR